MKSHHPNAPSLSGGLLLVGANGKQGRDGMMNRRNTIKMAVVPSDTKLQEYVK